MTERQRVGQLLMVDCSSTGVSSATVAAIQQYHVGAVILDGTSTAGRQATRNVTDQLNRLAPRRVGTRGRRTSPAVWRQARSDACVTMCRRTLPKRFASCPMSFAWCRMTRNQERFHCFPPTSD